MRGTEAPDDSDAELSGLLDLLDNQTRLATKSGMNADFILGMVTILHGDDLLTRGSHTGWGVSIVEANLRRSSITDGLTKRIAGSIRRKRPDGIGLWHRPRAKSC